MEVKSRSCRLVQIAASSLFRLVLNICDDFLARSNILATNQIARKTIEPFENNNKRSQGHLGEGGPLSIRTGKIVHHITNTAFVN